MAYTGQVANRPMQIDGCFQSFNESSLENTIRSQSDNNSVIKVRRRTTAIVRIADATVTVKQDEVLYWKQWYEIACQGGVLPSRFITPYGTEEIWRFAGPPTITWGQGAGFGSHAATITFKLEQLPEWRA
jgi:hypothetical protein